MGIFGFFNKNKKEVLDNGLEKTKHSVFDKISRAVMGKSTVDDEVLDNLEDYQAHRGTCGTRQVCVYVGT